MSGVSTIVIIILWQHLGYNSGIICIIGGQPPSSVWSPASQLCCNKRWIERQGQVWILRANCPPGLISSASHDRHHYIHELVSGLRGSFARQLWWTGNGDLGKILGYEQRLYCWPSAIRTRFYWGGIWPDHRTISYREGYSCRCDVLQCWRSSFNAPSR